MSFNFGDIEKKTVIFCFRLRQKKRRATKKTPTRTAKTVARQELPVALRATRFAAAVAQNSYFGPNVAPAQQRSSATANKCPGLYVIINLHTSLCHKVLMRDRSYLDNEVADSAAI